jgi:hypothetical protein
MVAIDKEHVGLLARCEYLNEVLIDTLTIMCELTGPHGKLSEVSTDGDLLGTVESFVECAIQSATMLHGYAGGIRERLLPNSFSQCES